MSTAPPRALVEPEHLGAFATSDDVERFLDRVDEHLAEQGLPPLTRRPALADGDAVLVEYGVVASSECLRILLDAEWQRQYGDHYEAAQAALSALAEAE
jgi:hypothetical protein